MHQEKRIRPEGLNDLLSHDCRAKEYYLTLPEDAQGMLQQHTTGIHSLEDMRSKTAHMCHKPPQS